MTSNFLTRILATKEQEVRDLKAKRGNSTRARNQNARGFAKQILTSDMLAVVAEVKKASPSKGVIEPDFHPAEVAATYQSAGAACISVLTDKDYFQGSIRDLTLVRKTVTLPVLRKDFIIDEVQLDEAAEAGADAVLLIVAALSGERLRVLSQYAHALGLDTLVEVHSEPELELALTADASVIGVNNRDLTTFEVRLETSERLIPQVPSGIPSLAESGIQTAEDALRMAACGASGLLVGESLMRAGRGQGVTTTLNSLRVAKPERSVRGRR